MKEFYGTLSETINALKTEGYTVDLNLSKEHVVCLDQKLSLAPDEFEIDKVFRFEGESNPEDQSVLYAISSEKHKIKGLLVNGYGIYADDTSAALAAKLDTHPHQK